MHGQCLLGSHRSDPSPQILRVSRLRDALGDLVSNPQTREKCDRRACSPGFPARSCIPREGRVRAGDSPSGSKGNPHWHAGTRRATPEVSPRVPATASSISQLQVSLRPTLRLFPAPPDPRPHVGDGSRSRERLQLLIGCASLNYCARGWGVVLP